jgi:F0F1-type ATP synthase membrane subunit c/vacuolar-type H+-ATPase subunit K
MEHLLFGFVSFTIAVVFGMILGGYAKYVKRDKRLTQTFIIVAIIATLALMIWAILYVE